MHAGRRLKADGLARTLHMRPLPSTRGPMHAQAC